MTDSELPEGWRWAALADVAEVVMGQSPPSVSYRDQPEGLPFFQGKADFGLSHPTPRKWCVAPRKVAKAGDILISVRAPVGPTNVADVECCIGRGLAAIRALDEMDQRFLLHALKTVEPEIVSRSTGTTFQAISGKLLRAVNVPVPPIDEQCRIVARLEKQMATAERARAAAAAQLATLEAMPQALLREIFPRSPADGLPVGWRSAKIGSVCEVLDARRMPITKSKREAGPYPYYGASGVVDHVASYLFDEPLVLVGEDGAKWAAGERTAFSITGKTWVNNHAHVLRPDRSVVLDAYLVAYLTNADLSPFITGLTVPKLNQQNLRSILVPLPSVEAQDRLMATLAVQSAAVEQAHVAAQTQLDAIDALPAAALRLAFAP